MPPFGKAGPEAAKLRIVPRSPGDTTPLSPAIAEALRKAGIDPDKFTVAPGDPIGAAMGGVLAAGSSLEHRFAFTDRADALRCVEAYADRGRPVTITKDEHGWTVSINSAVDPAVDDAEAHRRIAAEVAAFGGADRGLARESVTTRIRVR